MRKMLNFATAAALIAAPTAVFANNKTDKLAALEAKEDRVQAKQQAVEQKANGNPTAKQQAKLDKYASRLSTINASENRVENRIGKSN